MRRHGFSLLELTLVLVILAVLFTAGAPIYVHGRAALAVRAARSDLIATIALTRAQAILAGGAQLVVTPGGELRVERPDGVPLADPILLGTRYGVTVQTARNQTVVLQYDALGIGRITSTTIGVRRGSAAANVIVSAYGRART